MTLPADLLYLCLLAVSVIGLRRRGAWPFVISALTAAVLLVRDLVQLPEITWRIGVLDFVLAGLIAVLAIDLQGLPPSIARRVGFGFRSREWEFDDRLHLQKEALDQILMSYPHPNDWPKYRAWKADAIERTKSPLRRMRAMHPPDDEWERVRDDYVALYEGIFAGIANDEDPNDAHTLRVGQELKDRAGVLRMQYRASAQALKDGRGSRS